MPIFYKFSWGPKPLAYVVGGVEPEPVREVTDKVVSFPLQYFLTHPQLYWVSIDTDAWSSMKSWSFTKRVDYFAGEGYYRPADERGVSVRCYYTNSLWVRAVEPVRVHDGFSAYYECDKNGLKRAAGFYIELEKGFVIAKYWQNGVSFESGDVLVSSLLQKILPPPSTSFNAVRSMANTLYISMIYLNSPDLSASWLGADLLSTAGKLVPVSKTLIDIASVTGQSLKISASADTVCCGDKGFVAAFSTVSQKTASDLLSKAKKIFADTLIGSIFSKGSSKTTQIPINM